MAQSADDQSKGWQPFARGLLIPALALCCATITASAYWPGLMDWDPVHQYGEALGTISDWHPPAMQWLWRQLIRVASGPAPMLILQLTLYWGGLAFLASAVAKRHRLVLGCTVLACGLLPLSVALMGMIYKDCLMAGALLGAVGMLAWRRAGGRTLVTVLGVALLFFAATLRFNAFIACVPLLVAFLPDVWRRPCIRLAAASVVATLALAAAMPIANLLIRPAHSGVALSLVIFDLGGITERSGVNVFPADLEVPRAVAVNHTCYNPARWDSYADWVDPECPFGFTAWNDNVDSSAVQPYAFWLRAIAAHPLAYAEHRLNHFAINTRVLPLADTVQRPVPATDAPNPWGFHVARNSMTGSIDALALATAHTPLGWPIAWIGVAASALLMGRKTTHWALVAPIAWSSLLYGLGYLVFSVASELRYHLWTEVAALIAVVLALGDRTTRLRRYWSLTPVALAMIVGIIGRLSLG